MKINYIILAHNNFDHLTKLIWALDTPHSHFFVHIDKKHKINYKSNKSNVFVVSDHERINVFWGGFSIISATVLLLRKATKLCPADYYILLSGSDYPVISNQQIELVLSQGAEFINCKPAPQPSKPLKRFEYHHFEYQRKQYNLKWLFYRSIEELLKLFRRKRMVPFDVYVGSQWFALTNKCVLHTLNTIDNNRLYYDFFKSVLVPDESFFQTIIGNSPFKNNLRGSLTFVLWRSTKSPENLSISNINELKKKHLMASLPSKAFARKFGSSNKHVVNYIEKALRSTKQQSTK